MRTEEDFKLAYSKAEWLVRFHKKPFWVVPLEYGYGVSCFEPNLSDLPENTKALKI